MTYRIVCDGGLRPLGRHKEKVGYGSYKIFDATGKEICYKIIVNSGWTSANMAEYKIMEAGIRRALKLKIYDVEIWSDSALVCNQVNKVWRVNFEHLYTILLHIWEMQKRFNGFTVTKVPREIIFGILQH